MAQKTFKSSSADGGNSTKIVVAVLGVLFLGLLVFFIYTRRDSGSQFDWRPTYNERGRQPFDLAIFYNLFAESYPLRRMSERVPRELPADASAMGTMYCFIGNMPMYSEEEAEHILRYAENGGTVFIATEELPDSLMTFLLFRSDCNFMGNDNRPMSQWRTSSATVSANLTHPSLRAAQPYEIAIPEEAGYGYAQIWSYIPLTALCEYNSLPIALLGTATFDANLAEPTNDFDTPADEFGNRPLPLNPRARREAANFVRFTTQRGYIYIHTQPRYFTNYYMQEAAGLEYANKVLAHFDARDIYWDRVSTVPPKKRRTNTAEDRPPVPRNPMEYIYGQPALRSAWYVLLAGTLLFMIFRARRRQRTIPILDPNRNTSLEFIKTIGGLYFQQQNHRNIFQKIMVHFLAHLRRRYHIVVREGEAYNKALFTRIALRTEVDEAIVSRIFERYEQVTSQLKSASTEVSAETLNNFYLLVQEFHEKEQQNAFTEEKRRQIQEKAAAKRSAKNAGA